MISVQQMTFHYDKSLALKNVCFEEKEPIITGLWGRNGAGKTTLMRLLAGQLYPQQGKLQVLGQTPFNNEEILQSVCYMQENHPFSTLWNVDDALRFGRYYNPNWMKRQLSD